MVKRKASTLGRKKRRVSAKLVGTTPNALGRKGHTSDVGDNLLGGEQEATTEECDSLAAKSSQVPAETSTSSLVDELAKIPVPLQIVENSDGTLTISFTTTKEELKSKLKEMPSILAMPTIAEGTGTRTQLEESSEASETASAVAAVPPTYRRLAADFSDLPVRNLDQLAFRDNSKSVGGARVAKHRAVLKIVNAVKEAGNFNQQSLALHGALVNPELQEVSKCAGYCPESIGKKSSSYQLKQARRFLKLARTTNSRQGRCSDAKDSVVQSFMTAVAPSPDCILGAGGVPTRPQLLKSLGFDDVRAGSSRRLFALASNRRKAIREAQATRKDLWAMSRKRPKKRLKIDEQLRELLNEWIRNHEMVVISPIKDETLLVYNSLTGIKERKAKLLLCIPVRELHNDLQKEPPMGLAAAKDAAGKCLISDTMLRSLLPPELKPATNRHKQMCGCENCLTFRSIHGSLNAFRDRHLRTLETDDPNNDLEEYDKNIRLEGSRWHEKPADALCAVMCPPVIDNLRHFKCALRRCPNCPKYPIPVVESDTSDDAPEIKFHVYEKFTKCSKHGLLETNSKTCAICEQQVPILQSTNYRKGNVRTRKALGSRRRSIGKFMTEFYLPALEQFAYHLETVLLLSQMLTGKARQNAFIRLAWTVLTRRDYAERLNAKFNLEIQSDHFGNDRDLSIEGVSVHMHELESLVSYLEAQDVSTLVQRMEFHSHFSDNSKQDAATTHEHMDHLVNLLFEKGVMKRGSWMLDNTDGCAKQYRCGTALYLLALLAVTHGIVVDRAIGAPGHGKCEVDGGNAVDKRFIEKKMCLVEAPDADASSRRMAAHAMAEGAMSSFAAECVRICSTRERAEGVKSEVKSKKREAQAKMKSRHYHIQDPNMVRFGSVKMQATGFPSVRGETRNGMAAMYNFRADPDLGMRAVAARRIPCACMACIEQLQLEWLPGNPAETQPRYLRNTQCQWFGIFDGLNDWQIIALKPRADADEDELEEAHAYALNGIETMNSEKVEVGKHGAFGTNDPDADGYYVVQWTTDPYTLQDDLPLESGTFIPGGEIVCDATYFRKVPRAKQWYIPETSEAGENVATTVRMKHVVAPYINVLEVSDENKLPNTCNKRQILPLNPIRISPHDHNAIHDEICRREELDYEEEGPAGEDDDDEEESMSEDSED
jgi:hypothetical protein